MGRKKWTPSTEPKPQLHGEDERLRIEVAELLKSVPPDHPAVEYFHHGPGFTMNAMRMLEGDDYSELRQAISDAWRAFDKRRQDALPRGSYYPTGVLDQFKGK